MEAFFTLVAATLIIVGGMLWIVDNEPTYAPKTKTACSIHGKGVRMCYTTGPKGCKLFYYATLSNGTPVRIGGSVPCKGTPTTAERVI